jgi:hypothetical protein
MTGRDEQKAANTVPIGRTAPSQDRVSYEFK